MCKFFVFFFFIATVTLTWFIACILFDSVSNYGIIGQIKENIYTHVAAVVLTPLTTHPHTQAELERSPVRGQEQEQSDVSPLPS